MNIMRKLWVAGGVGGAAGGGGGGGGGDHNPAATAGAIGGGAPSQQDTALGVKHLKKLFTEYTRPPEPLSERDRDTKLYNMLPLFCKLFDGLPSSELLDKFTDAVAFCQQASRLMVAEIRRRASNQSTEAASSAIARFLEMQPDESSEQHQNQNQATPGNGWMLLLTLNLLASTGDSGLIGVMTSASVPSTLVKCLYLFFDLPEMSQTARDNNKELHEPRILLQKVFVQVLVRLGAHVQPAEELARKDDLMLLFSAISSGCPTRNRIWRESAAEVLVTLSRHALSPTVMHYVHDNRCLGHCVENMQKSRDLTPLEVVEMVSTVFCLLKDSSETAQTLLDDFRACQGYVFLSDFLLRLDQEVYASEGQTPEGEDGDACEAESRQAIRNLVFMVASLSTCGFIELRPNQASISSTLFQLPGFSVPQPTGRGVSVRNVQAFQVLQSVFLKASSAFVCHKILDAVSSVYHSDAANYFILEGQNTLPQFAERIHLKTERVRDQFFALLEFVVFQLQFVPCKELISLSLLLKANHSESCSSACSQTLISILKHHPQVFRDVYREVGILEVFVSCLLHYSSLLVDSKKPGSNVVVSEGQERLGFLSMEALTVLLSGNTANATVFRESGGARCAVSLVQHLECRQQALGMIRQLMLSSGGEDDMATLLGMVHSAPSTDLDLKAYILKSLLRCLRESHRTRTAFRKVGGFVYVMSVLVSMEGALSNCTSGSRATPPPWDTIPPREIWAMLHLVFNVLTVAMRFEPANAKFFHQEICPTSLCDTVRLLGCFSTSQQLPPSDGSLSSPNLSRSGVAVTNDDDMTKAFHQLFTGSITEPLILPHIPITLAYACLMLRLLYDMSLDEFDKVPAVQLPNPQSSPKSTVDAAGSRKTNQPSSLALAPPAPEPVIVHPGVVVAILHLLPSIHHQEKKDYALSLQCYASEVLRTLLRSEHNQQVMCESGFPSELLNRFGTALSDEKHSLHPPLQYMLERLSAQALEPKDLRVFLRLGDPLRCSSEDDHSMIVSSRSWGGPVPLTRIKTLVSMTTPKDFRLHGTSILPPFVELSMASEGFACLFLPSVAPQSPGGPSVVPVGVLGVATDTTVVGGIGAGDRMFPPQPGLTFSTWISVDRYSCSRTDPHPIRLLTLARHVHPGNSSSMDRGSTSSMGGGSSSESHLMCLSIAISARDRAVIVSTQETSLPPAGCSDWEPDGSGDSGVRVWLPDLLQEGQWHHLVFVLNRAVLKNSSFSLYVDGQHAHTQKLHYISQNPGGAAANLTVASSVYGYIGTPPNWRRHSRLSWKQGACHLLEEVLTTSAISTLFRLGPHYVGSLQAPETNGGEALGPLIAEEKVVLGLNATAVTQLTLARMRKVYSRADCRSVAKQLGMSTHENATPIRILHNSAGHLSGPARSLGGVVVGYLGVRVFSPRPVAKSIEDVGGCDVLLGLIAMARDVESLYASVKALVCVARSNVCARHELDRRRGYQTLSMLLKKKRHLLNSHILHLTFGLVGTVDSGRESTFIPNVAAFRDLLADLEVWHESPADLERSLYEHICELTCESNERMANVRILRDLDLVTRLLHMLRVTCSNISTTGANPILSAATTKLIFNILAALLADQPRHGDLLSFGQLVVWSLPTMCASEKGLQVGNDEDALLPSSVDSMDEGCPVISVTAVRLRNRCLRLLLSLITGAASCNAKNSQQCYVTPNPIICEEIVRVLGLDWILLFLQSHLHPSTIVLAARCLVTVLTSSKDILQKFRDGGTAANGGWLSSGALMTRGSASAAGLVLIGNPLELVGRSSSFNKEPAAVVKEAALHVPGFQQLGWMAARHSDISQLYFLLVALLLGQPGLRRPPPLNAKLDLASVWDFVFGGTRQCPIIASIGRHPHVTVPLNMLPVCPEAAVVILQMVRSMLNAADNDNSTSSWLQTYPEALLRLLLSLYQSVPEFAAVFLLGSGASGIGSAVSSNPVPTPGEEVLIALASTIFPIPTPQQTSHSEGDSQEMVVVEVLPQDKDRLLGTSTDCRQLVMDFLRTVIVDSLALPQTGKSPPVIDILLDVSPEGCTHRQQCLFQTELLSALISHLLRTTDPFALPSLAADLTAVANNNNRSLGNKQQHVPANLFYVAGRIVDKMWLGAYTEDPHNVFDFLVFLVAQAKKRTPAPPSSCVDSLYRSLNRTVLYLLSRPTDGIAEQTAVLEALHKVTNHRGLVFGVGNHELEFVGCLVYCLLQLTADFRVVTDSSCRTTWHVNPSANESDNYNPESPVAEQGQNLVAVAARRVWEELYVCKKPSIEEVFKVTLAGGAPDRRRPSLQALRDHLQESACRLWMNYIDAEKRAAYRTTPWELHSQLQSKIQKVTGGLTRLASRTKARREDSVRQMKQSGRSVLPEQLQKWTFGHIALVKEIGEERAKDYQQSQLHMNKFVFDEWLQTEAELTRERGLWGPQKPCTLDKWMLDMTEGPCRMRKKMIRNDAFYIHYPYRPEVESIENRALKYKVATSYDSKEYYQQRNLGEGMSERDAEELRNSPVPVSTPPPESADPADDDAIREIGFQGLLFRPKVNRAVSELDDDTAGDVGSGIGELAESVESSQGTEESTPNNQSLLRMLEPGEKISYMFRCARIQGLDTAEGLLLFGREHFYVADGFTVIRGREIKDIDCLPPGAHEPILPPGSHEQNPTGMTHRCSRFAYEDVREVHKRRYLLQPIALEVFSADGRNYLLAFPRKVRNKVYQRLMVVATGIQDNAHQSVAGQKRTASVEQTAGLFASLIGETSVTQRWVRGEISNFQYLMHLNTLAGRSYNDLMQYPVFPWILSEYDADELDLNDPATFRDFSKPMGAQSSDRLEQFRKRYAEWDDPHGETPPYHYGTHYSSAMIVCSYLVRMEPFTQHFLRLQGGHFDLADRMFHSIKEGWLSASKHNMADVKELIPEFFYLPEFLSNSNNFDLGCKQNGVQLGDVILPPWAKEDPREFIRAHREALECDYVSQHLHEWIDLIFGYKQQGPMAVEATNVFHHLFYEGNVDIYSIEDPLKKNATIGFINNFGQIPKQLFKKPHPAKRVGNTTVTSSASTAGSLSSLTAVGGPSPSPSSSFLDVAAASAAALNPMGGGSQTIASINSRMFYRNLDNLRPSMQPIKELKGAVGQIVGLDKSGVAAVEQNKCVLPAESSSTSATTSSLRCVGWGFADHSLRVGPYDSERALFTCEAPQCGQILSCVAPSARIVVTGGANSVVTVWELSQRKRRLKVKQSLYGHTDGVTCLGASPAFNVVVSGSKDRTAIVWDLSRLAFVRQLGAGAHEATVAAVAVSETTGDIATCAGTWLHVWTVNGDEVARVNTAVGWADRLQQILCVAFSTQCEWDPCNVVMTGSTDGVVRMWSVDYVQVPLDDLVECSEQRKESTASSEPLSPSRPAPPIPTEDREKEVCEENTNKEDDANISEEDQMRARVRRISLTATELTASSENKGLLAKSASESSLSEEEGPDTKQKPLAGPVKHLHRQTALASTSSMSSGGGSMDEVVVPRRNRNRLDKPKQAEHRKSEGFNLSNERPDAVLAAGSDQTPVIRASKSDTSLTDSFVMVGEEEVSQLNPLNSTEKSKGQTVPSSQPRRSHHILREGFKWQCQLVFRSKLTMHTAFDRKDNAEPASVTALAVSKDHRTVYVGDARGRVFSWSVCEQSGRVADHWLKDDGSDNCVGCNVRFSLYERRHHCRNCGQLFCSRCSRFESEIVRLRITRPVRVCQPCHQQLRQEK